MTGELAAAIERVNLFLISHDHIKADVPYLSDVIHNYHVLDDPAELLASDLRQLLDALTEYRTATCRRDDATCHD